MSWHRRWAAQRQVPGRTAPSAQHGNNHKGSPSEDPQRNVDDSDLSCPNFSRHRLLICVAPQRNYVHISHFWPVDSIRLCDGRLPERIVADDVDSRPAIHDEARC